MITRQKSRPTWSETPKRRRMALVEHLHLRVAQIEDDYRCAFDTYQIDDPVRPATRSRTSPLRDALLMFPWG